MEFLTLIRAQWDRTAAIVFVAIGLLVLLFGWIGVSGAEAVVKQLPYIISGGIGGIVFVAIGAVMWVSADLRDEWREIRKLRLQVGDLSSVNDLRLPAGLPGLAAGLPAAEPATMPIAPVTVSPRRSSSRRAVAAAGTAPSEIVATIEPSRSRPARGRKTDV